jgi:Flp pilus assembly protein TadB
MAPPIQPAKGPGSRTLIFAIVLAAAILALLPLLVARTRRVQTMRVDLAEVLDQCRARYAAAHTAADTAAADAWQPALHGELRSGDPACGPYRRRNMLRTGPR